MINNYFKKNRTCCLSSGGLLVLDAAARDWFSSRPSLWGQLADPQRQEESNEMLVETWINLWKGYCKIAFSFGKHGKHCKGVHERFKSKIPAVMWMTKIVKCPTHKKETSEVCRRSPSSWFPQPTSPAKDTATPLSFNLDGDGLHTRSGQILGWRDWNRTRIHTSVHNLLEFYFLFLNDIRVAPQRQTPPFWFWEHHLFGCPCRPCPCPKLSVPHLFPRP